ncbi:MULTISPECIES: AAA family ATPase [Arthrobacter]|uniref:AAA family ATPase n=1 Tax=Arthrobacter terricola TaxID=2547396 RepID=A0A4R5KBZ4_9MICC|nr:MULTISPECIES: MoxR family ATPase [Arthrobacter]MBT8162933.1 MoxR family ATPase [Arthrobacter sp. GN70]TDF91657.1 AAA family ATPase [Arthrobacter terricola]
MRFNDILSEIVKQDLEMNIVPALMGEPGIGKSSFVEALAYSMNTKAFVLPCNQLADKADLTGARLVPTENGSFKQVFYPHHVIQDAIDYAEANPREWPILFLDEVNRTTSDVTSGALTLVTLRKMGHVELPKNVRIIVAGNDKGNVTTLDEASLSRFSIYRVEPEAATLLQILGDELNPWVRKVLTQFPAMIFQKPMSGIVAADGADDEDENTTSSFAELFDSGEEMNQLTTPRTIDNLSRWLNKADRAQLGRYLAMPTVVGDRETTVLNEVVESHVGNTAFAVQVVAAIAEDLASGAGQQASHQIVVPKPNCYADLKAAQSITDLETIIAVLTDSDKSGSLLYALKEHEDNERLIHQLAQATHQIEAAHTRTLFELVSAQQADTQNVEAFLGSGAPVAEAVKPMLSAFL